MIIQIKSIIDKLKLSLCGTFNTLKNPKYLLLFILMFLAFGLILTASAFGSFYWSLLFSRLGAGDKLQIIGEIFLNFLFITKPLGIITMIISLSQGICIALLVYNYRHQPKINFNQLSGSTASTFLAAIGLGCPMCGTSLIAPIIGIFSSNYLSILNAFNLSIVLLSLIISLYIVWKLGYIAYANQANQLYLTRKEQR